MFSGLLGFLGILEHVDFHGGAINGGVVSLVEVLVVEEFGDGVFEFCGRDVVGIEVDVVFGVSGVCFESSIEEACEFVFVVIEVCYVDVWCFLDAEGHGGASCVRVVWGFLY